MSWKRDTSTPARCYRSKDGRYEILWDPAGRYEDEPGGWYLHDGPNLLGIFPTLKAAKEAAT